MPYLNVDCGRAVRLKIEVTPNTTLGEVLTSACARRGLDASAHGLRHGRTRKALDATTIFRLSGLDNNATVELTDAPAGGGRSAAVGAAAAAPGGGAPVRVALQLESGERRTGELAAGASLYETLQALCPELLAPGALAAGHVPGIVDGRPVSGVAELSATTLAAIGVKPGTAALLRFRSAPEAEAPAESASAAAEAAPPASVAQAASPSPAPPAVPPPLPTAQPAPQPAAASLPAPSPLPAPSAPAPVPAPVPSPAPSAVTASALAAAADGSVLDQMLGEALLAFGRAAESLAQQYASDATAHAAAAAAALPPDPADRGAAPAPPAPFLNNDGGPPPRPGDSVRSLLLMRK